MKLRDMMFLVIGGLLVISGMVLNALLSGDAEAQGGLKNAEFGFITCKGLYLTDGYKNRGYFGLDSEFDAIFEIYGDDGKHQVAYLGVNDADENGEMMLQLKSKSKTDKRKASMMIGTHGGTLSCGNKMGENVVLIGVGGDGAMGTLDRFGNVK